MVDQVYIYLFILNYMNKIFLHSMNLRDCTMSLCVYMYVYIHLFIGGFFFMCLCNKKV